MSTAGDTCRTFPYSAEVKQQSVQNGGKNAKLGRFVNFYVGNQE